MKRLICLCAIALSLAPFCIAHAAPSYYLGDLRLALIDDPLRVEFQNPPADLTRQKMQQVIAIVAASKEWKVVAESEGRTELTALMNDKHFIKVEVTYDTAGFGIRYLDSKDLLYRELKPGGSTLRAIHRNYNYWIRELASAIGNAMRVQTRTTAGFAPLDNIDAVPYLREKGRNTYKEFLGKPVPRAFAIAPNGALGWASNSGFQNNRRFDPVEAAMERCNHRGKGQCKLYVVDDHVVWTK